MPRREGCVTFGDVVRVRRQDVDVDHGGAWVDGGLG
jgi:hypothetical protein